MIPSIDEEHSRKSYVTIHGDMAPIAQIKEPETVSPKKEDESENLPVNKE